MSKRKSLIGKIFNDLTVLSNASIVNNRTYSKCLCICGNTIVVMNKRLQNNHTKSCGCRRGNKLLYNIQESLARNIWYKYGKEFEFKKFYSLIKENCIYCNPQIIKLNQYNNSIML